MKKIVTIFLALAFLGGCEKHELKNEDEVIFENVELGLNEYYSGFKDLKVCLVSVSDSRCPKGVVCFWEGNGSAKLKMELKNIKHEFELNTNQKFKTDTILSHYYISLIHLLPYPEKGITISESEHEARLLIADLNKLKSNASVLGFTMDPLANCGSWSIKMGNDTIRSNDYLLSLRVGYNIPEPVDVYIELGDQSPNCKGIVDGRYYKLKEIIKTR